MINDNEVYHFSDGGYKLYNYTLDDPSAATPAVLQTLEMEVGSPHCEKVLADICCGFDVDLIAQR